MKFLIIAGFAESLISFRKELIISLLNKGFKVHVAAPELSINKAVVSELIKLGVVTHDIPLQRTGMNPIADLYTLFSLWLLMLQIKPHYVLSYTIKPVIYGAWAAWLARVPYRFSLITGLGFSFIDDKKNQRNRIRNVVQTMYKTALRHCQKVFFQNPDDEALFRKLNIISSLTNSYVVNGSGVDVTKFKATLISEKSSPRFLLIARLLGDKGIREYVQAAQKIKHQFPNTQFDLVGWIDSNPNAITQIELDQWISAGTVNFLGRLNDVRPAISNCSVYVLPSYREGTPRTVLEAMSMGRAIITTDAPGCRETVVDNDNGFLVPVKSVDALVVAMRKLIDNPELIKKMGQRSREIAEEKYDVNKVNAIMLREMGI